MLDANRNNYLAAVVMRDGRIGLAYCDITTGEFAVTELSGSDAPGTLQRELERLQPAELIWPEAATPAAPQYSRQKSPPAETVEHNKPQASEIQALLGNLRTLVSQYAGWHFDPDTARAVLLDHFHTATLDGYGCSGMPLAISTAGAVVQYLKDTQPAALAQLIDLRTYSTDRFMLLDGATRRNLELTRSMRGTAQGSLLGVLDRTLTPMGARLLHTWLNQPLLERAAIEARLDAVQFFVERATLRAELRAALKPTGDVERLTNRIVQGVVLPRELLAYRAGLERLPVIAQHLSEAAAPVGFAAADMNACLEASRSIAAAISDDPPATLNDTGVIRAGYSAELDGVAQASRDAKAWVANLERSERERTGIRTLKVGYNQVFGYYIEISKGQSEHAPENYIRKQTLSNAERYITPELKEYESLILNADERILDLERQVYKQLLRQITGHAANLLHAAHVLAELDVYVAFAEVAVLNRYVRPVICDGRELVLTASRHPVVELSAREEPFIPNDVRLADGELVVLTGPNMAGKTTFMRQVALSVLMAQVGSFVPADAATIGVVDRIFTRVGAQDDISAGQSTFMVEMVETANILHHATARSLLILDEIGRGTSTYDGLSIAWAVVEYIHNHPRLQAKTFFATHYHELIALGSRLPRVRNFNVAVSEADGRVTFLRKIVPGGADRSYGIHVAQLAGLPRSIVQRAEEILRDLESQASGPRATTGRPKTSVIQPALFDLSNPMVEELKALDLAAMSPLEALNKLYQWQSETKKGG